LSEKNASADRKQRATIVAAAICGIAAAGEVAANVIASATGHAVGPHVGIWFAPWDGLSWLWKVNQYCTLMPHAQELRAALNPLNVAAPVHSLCRLSSPTVTRLNVTTGAVASLGFAPLLYERAKQWFVGAEKPGRVLPKVKRDAKTVVIELGETTGQMADGLAEAGLRAGQILRIVGRDLCVHTLILGETGRGKTTNALIPILHQALAQGCGAVIGNAKGNFHRIVLALGEQTGRDIRVIGIGADAEAVNLCEGMTPAQAKAYLSAMIRSIDKSKDGSTWINLAVNLTYGTFGILHTHAREFPQDRSHCSFPGISRYLWGEGGVKQAVNARVTEKMTEWLDAYNSLEDGSPERDPLELKMREVAGYYNAIAEYEAKTDPQKNSVDIALQQMLSQLMTPEVEDAFFNTKPRKRTQPPFSFAQTYEDGEVFVINAPEAKIGADTSALLISLVKQAFFSAMELRLVDDDANQDRLVGGFFDEYQDFATAGDQKSDDTVLAKLRETGCFMVCATTSIAQLNAKLGEDKARSLIGNFAHRIIFGIKEIKTTEDVLKLFGEVEVERESTSETRGKNGTSKGTSKQRQMQAAARAELFLNLKRGQALVVATLYGETAVDIVNMRYENPLAV
jgi:hypothetical protein